MKKQLKSLIALSLSLVLLTLPMISFANTSGEGQAPKVSMEERLDSKFNERQNFLNEKRAQTEEQKALSQERLTQIIQKFAPALEDDFQSFWNQHESLHVALIAEQERFASDNQVQTMAFFDNIKSQVLDKTITREEAKAKMLVYRDEAKSEREAIKAELDALKEAIDVPREVVKVLFDALKVAVENEDQVAVEAALIGLIELQPSHLAFDQAKLEFLMTN